MGGGGGCGCEGRVLLPEGEEKGVVACACGREVNWSGESGDAVGVLLAYGGLRAGWPVAARVCVIASP